MRSFRLPWRRQPDTPHAEPVMQAVQREAADVEREAEIEVALPDIEPAEHREGRGAILELIGSSGIDGRPVRQHGGAQASQPGTADDAARADDLVESLHAQYWQALSDPNASLGDSWDVQPDANSAHTIAHDAPQDWQRQGEHAEHGSIETFLADKRTLEEVFGRLDEGPALGLGGEPVPEVLWLFAPPEYQAAAQRRPPALPPALTRREHHALSVDSPLAAPTLEDDL